MARLILEVTMCSFEWWSYTLKCTRSFLNISQFSLNNKQWTDQNSKCVIPLYLTSRKTHAFLVLFSMYGKAVVVAMQTAAHLMLTVCYGPVFLRWKGSNPLLFHFSCPFCHLLSSHTSQQEPAALPSYRDSLPVGLRNKLYSHMLYFLRHRLSQLECVFLQGLTASQLALVWLCAAYTNNIMLV